MQIITDEGVEGVGWAHGTDVVVDTMLKLKQVIIVRILLMLSEFGRKCICQKSLAKRIRNKSYQYY